MVIYVIFQFYFVIVDNVFVVGDGWKVELMAY